MPNDFSLAIYKHSRRDGTEILVPLLEMDEDMAKRQGYELRKVFPDLSNINCSVAYNAAMLIRETHTEKGLISKLKEMFKYL